MPFRMPPPTSSSSASPTSPSSQSRPNRVTPHSAHTPSVVRSTSTATLRLPGPPLPPKPLHLTVRHHSTLATSSRFRPAHVRSGGTGTKGLKRGELPRWSKFEGAPELGEEDTRPDRPIKFSDRTTGPASTSLDSPEASRGTSLPDSREAARRKEEEDPTIRELLATSQATPQSRSLASRMRSSDDNFKSAVDTLRIPKAGEGGSTIGRKSIYFDPSEENPFLPPPLLSATARDPLSEAGETQLAADEDGAGNITTELARPMESPSAELPLLSAFPSSNLPGSPSIAPEHSQPPFPQLELPLSPTLAVSLHPFTGETSFGELSFAQGIELCVEIEDLGGGWSLGFVKEAGEETRGLIPRGWYAYIDVPADDHLRPHTTSGSASTKEAHQDEFATATRPPTPPGLPSIQAQQSSGALPTSSAPPFTPSASLPVEPENPESPARSPRSPSASPSRSVRGYAEAPEILVPYATRSIGRHLVISGAEFEPIEVERERGNEGTGKIDDPQASEGSVDEGGLIVEAEIPELTRQNDEETLGPQFVGATEGVATQERFQGSSDSPSSLRAIDQDSTSSFKTETRPSVIAAGSTDSPVACLAAPRPHRATSSSQGSLLYRLGFASSPSSAVSRSYVLGGLSIPGASILAHSHPRRPPSPPLELKRPRMSRSLGVMSGRGYVMEWIRQGDELDDEIKEETQIWEIDNDNGPIWRTTSEPFVVQVHSPRKLSPLGETPYTTFDLTTHFPISPSAANPAGILDGSPGPLTVSRRFSHFVSLHQLLSSRYSLLSMPPLPTKAFGAARFAEDFLEERRRDLERWVERVVNHPVLRESEEVRGFLAIEEDQELRALLSTATTTTPTPLFFARVFHSEFNVDLHDAIDIGERFERHARAIELGGSVRDVEASIQALRESMRENANSVHALGTSLGRLVAGLSLPPTSYDPVPSAEDIELQFNETEYLRSSGRAREWNVQNEERAMTWKEEDADALAMSKAVQATGEALAEISEGIDLAARYELDVPQLGLQELAQPASQYSNLIAIHKEVATEYRRLSRLSNFERTEKADQVARCETILNITCAEMEYVRCDRIEGLKAAVKSLLDAQIDATEKSLEQLQFARGHFDAAALQALALTGSRLRSPLEQAAVAPRYPALPVTRSFMVPRSTTEASE
ncbi:hypothetical protein JCM11491_007076 [Sporobolomyces phaffii]